MSIEYRDPMKIALPRKTEVGNWLFGLTVCCAGIVASKGNLSEWFLPGVVAWLFLAACILVFLTIRATVRQRNDVASE